MSLFITTTSEYELEKSKGAATPRGHMIPTNLRVKGVMSDTALAAECFVNQRFSNKLQAYLISYVNTVYQNHPIYA